MFRLAVLSCLAALTFAETLTLSQEAKDKFINLHNEIRAATGADNMPDLVWDETLAAKAREYSDKCEFAHDSSNSYGENIYLGWGASNTDGTKAANNAVRKWGEEIANVDDDGSWDCIANDPENTCGHYSQEVWAKTTKLGCGVTTNCELWGYTWTMVFCEYEPRGNMMKSYDSAAQKWIAKDPY